VTELGSTNLASATTWAEQPSFSPDGSQIVFHRISMDAETAEGRPTGSSLFIVNRDGTGLHEVAIPGKSPDGDASWSPRLSGRGSATWIQDGQRILYCDQARIKVMDADGTHSVALALGPSMVNGPTGFTYYAFWQPQP
jgi:Tol biopolymer transport system component